MSTWGVGLERDLQTAIRSFRLAIDGGDWEAHARLGVCYLYAEGAERDVGEAVRLIKMAADNGNVFRSMLPCRNVRIWMRGGL